MTSRAEQHDRTGLPSGLKVLVVEDEAILCMQLEDMLSDLGCTLVGPAMHLDQALALAAASELDIAILDVNLNGARSDAVADRLAGRGLPFVFATGYGASGSDSAYPGAPVLKKPFSLGEFSAAMKAALG